MPTALTLPLVCVVVLCALWPQRAGAEVRRCVTPEEKVVFTDRTCGEIGAVERAAPPRVSPIGAHAYRGCARTVQDLVFEMTAAIDTQDTNRFANVYHWAGMSGSAGYQVLSKLDAIVKRRLVDIVPVMPQVVPTTHADADATDDVSASAGTEPTAGELYPQDTVRLAPVALRLEQTLDRSAIPARTVFALTRHLGCWWVRL